MLTIFSIPKAFKGHIGVIQRNALKSWTLLRPRPEVILLGDDEGVAEAAQEAGVRHFAGVAKNEYGTPLFNDMFRQAELAATSDLMCYVNADIILTSDLCKAIEMVLRNRAHFLLVSRRINLNITQPIDFSSGWESAVLEQSRSEGIFGDATNIDIFVFKKGAYPRVPPFGLGRLWFDHWLIKAALDADLPVIDATLVAPVLHQNHDYNHVPGGAQWVWQGKEAETNFKLYGGGRYSCTISSATHDLLPDGGLRRVFFREQRGALKRFLWEIFVRRTHSLRSRLHLSRTPVRNS